MTRRTYIAIAGLCVFFLTTFTVAISTSPHFPALLISGERSVGTWMSGILLAVSGTCSLVIGMKRSTLWFALSAFFGLLALDERFMFHERIKEKIIFNSNGMAPRWLYELPVLFAGAIGVVIVCIMWKSFARTGRLFLVAGTLFGGASVLIDVLGTGVLWEDSFKLVGELAMACALLIEIQYIGHEDRKALRKTQ